MPKPNPPGFKVTLHQVFILFSRQPRLDDAESYFFFRRASFRETCLRLRSLVDLPNH